jgi:TolA-binding protein
MKIPFALLFAVLLSACSVFAPENLGPGAASRDQLWRQGHAALQADSFRVAMAAFQRLAAEHPRDNVGREARFYLGTLYLDPANPAYDANQAAQNLEMYLATDTAGGRVTRRPEAETLLGLARQMVLPCEQRTGALRCDPDVIVRTRPGGADTVVVRQGTDQSAEVARLRRDLNERDATIRQLREELQRIRNTLAPRP